MKISVQSREFSKKELFKIVNDSHILLKDVPDSTVINVCDYVRYTTDEGKEIAIFWHTDTETGVITTVATSSPSVIKTCESAFAFMEDFHLSFRLKRNTSKAGRTFMNLELV